MKVWFLFYMDMNESIRDRDFDFIILTLLRYFLFWFIRLESWFDRFFLLRLN